MSSSRPYGGDEGPRPRRALRLVLVFFFLMVFLVALAAAALVVDPGLAYVFPDPPAGRLHRFADDLRTSLAGLFADDGPLAAVRRLADPYLSRVGLNLETVLIGAGLLLLAILCIRVLAVTSRPPDEEYAEEVFGRQREAAEGPAEGSPYWPYDARPGPPPVGAGRFSAGPVGAGTLRARRGPAAAPPHRAAPGEAESFSFPHVATGDAWPGAEARGPEEMPQEMPRERPSEEGPREAFAETRETPSLKAPEETARTTAAEPPGDARVVRLETAAAAEGAAAGAAALAYEAETEEQALRERRGEPRTEPGPYAALREHAHPREEADAAWPREEAWRPSPGPYAQDRGDAAAERSLSAGWTGEPPPEAPPVQEVVVRARPPLRTGLRKFVVPGMLLAALGAGGAYGLQTTYAAVLLASPYAGLILAGAAAGLGTLVAAWFSAGPMKAVAVRTAAWGPAAAEGPARAGVGGRPAPGPAPAGGAGGSQAGGLETPDAADWS
ncbi:MAG TPA: hypothetical protein DHW14_09425, partial [Clostridiales bacterium]|nr:hypothetical protein [Clostridiales bacterium]